jgi:hypothetical protein
MKSALSGITGGSKKSLKGILLEVLQQSYQRIIPTGANKGHTMKKASAGF